MVRMTSVVIRNTSLRRTSTRRGGHGRGIPGDLSGPGTPRGCSPARWSGRLPNATAAIADRAVRPRGGRRPTASPGALAAVYGVANAVGQPLLGRLVDLLRAAAGAAARPRCCPRSAMAVFAFVGHRIRCRSRTPRWLVAGLFTPPLEGGLRALWPSVLRREDQVHAAYAMDAVAQEVMFTVGPLLVTLCVAAVVGGGRAARAERHRGAGRAVGGRLAALAARGVRRRARRTGWARCVRRGCWRCSARSSSSGSRSARSRSPPWRTRTTTAATWSTAG